MSNGILCALLGCICGLMGMMYVHGAAPAWLASLPAVALYYVGLMAKKND